MARGTDMTLFANFSNLTGDEKRPWALLSCKIEISKLISSGIIGSKKKVRLSGGSQ